MKHALWVSGAAMLLATPASGQLCLVSADPISFGTYMPFSGAASDSSGAVRVSCNAAVSVLVGYSLQLSSGGSGNIAARRMTGPGSPLPYQLFRDSARAQVWGDGTAGSFSVTDGYLLSVLAPVIRSYAVYGRLTVPAQAVPGMYSDVVTVFLNF